jgi:hypothetical protein
LVNKDFSRHRLLVRTISCRAQRYVVIHKVNKAVSMIAYGLVYLGLLVTENVVRRSELGVSQVSAERIGLAVHDTIVANAKLAGTTL